MKIAIDAQLAIGTATGIGEYVLGLSSALRLNGIDVVELSDAALDPWRFDRRVYWDQILLPQRARASGADLLHCASGTMPLSKSIPTIVTVHDVAWLRVQSHTRPYARYYFGRFASNRYRTAAKIVVGSEFSQRELVDVLALSDEEARRVSVVYPGVSSEFINLSRSRANDHTILVVGTIERRKNLALIIRALAHIPDARVIALGPFTPYVDECMSLAYELGVLDRVDIRGYAPRGDVLALYASCDVLCVPSVYEGFGYAAAQALCSGTPLIASNGGSLAEIVSGDAPILSPTDDEAWVDAISDALGNAQFWEERAARVRPTAVERFRWDASAREMAKVYSSVALACH